MLQTKHKYVAQITYLCLVCNIFMFRCFYSPYLLFKDFYFRGFFLSSSYNANRSIPQNIDNNRNPHIRTQYRTLLVLHGYCKSYLRRTVHFLIFTQLYTDKTLQSTTDNKIVSMNWHRPRTLSLSSRHYHHSADSFNLSSLHT
jgi:hypothetical protein